MRFLVTHPPDPRPVLVVETVACVDAAAVASVKAALLRLGCPNGLVFDASECVILRDTYASLDAGSLAEDGRVSTDLVLARVAKGRALDERVFDWLRSMASSWDDALPSDQDVAARFIADIVPAVSGSSVRQVA